MYDKIERHIERKSNIWISYIFIYEYIKYIVIPDICDGCVCMREPTWMCLCVCMPV